MTSSPIIGIPCRQDTSGIYNGRPINAQNTAYINAVIQAGGIPLLIPLDLDEAALRTVFDRLDGVLLAGGGDIDPAYYGEVPHETVSRIEVERDKLEMVITRWAAKERKPLFGICRGIQVMAVAVGGTLWQDVPSQLPEVAQQPYTHGNWHEPRDTVTHETSLSADSRLAKIVDGDVIPTNSLHHQAVKDLPEPYQVIGYAPDGVIEAIDLPDHPFFCGVQWHPEELVGSQESARRLFSAFVEACR